MHFFKFCDIGVVAGIEANHKTMEKAVAGQEVCIKIEPTGDAPRMYGRHFTHEDLLMSKVGLLQRLIVETIVLRILEKSSEHQLCGLKGLT